MLAARSEQFSRTARNLDALLEFKLAVERRESQQRPFAEFHHCPYIGLIGRQHSRVGCLLHPYADGNQRVDYRGISYYGGMACRTYFCPACRRLPANIKRIVQHLAVNWHGYGMMITETTMLQAIFGEIEQRLRRSIDWPDIHQNSACQQAIREILELKSRWPFRRSFEDGACHYFFSSPAYRRPAIDYAAIGRQSSRYDVLFKELVSSFKRPEELAAAENYLEERFHRIVETAGCQSTP